MFRALDDITLNFDITTPTARGKCHPNFTDEKGEFQRGEVAGAHSKGVDNAPCH